MIHHCGTKQIQTSNLLLRSFIISDAKAIFQNWANDPEVTRFLTWFPHPDIAESRRILNLWLDEYKNPDFYQWAIELKEIGEPIGSIGVVNYNNHNEMAELGYCIGRKWWGKGLAAEALQMVIIFLFENVGFERIQALHYAENKASGRVMQKAGMQHEGRLRHYHKNKEGCFVDMELYAILKTEISKTLAGRK